MVSAIVGVSVVWRRRKANILPLVGDFGSAKRMRWSNVDLQDSQVSLLDLFKLSALVKLSMMKIADRLTPLSAPS
jgi:hypothetical protein